MPEYACPNCGDRLESESARCPTCHGIATPEDARQAKVTPTASSDGAFSDGLPPLVRDPSPSIARDAPHILRRLLPYFIFAGIALLAVALIVPAVQKVREAAARTQTICNFKIISLSCQDYHDATKRLPTPAMIVQKDGKQREVQLSWRVAIVPYIDSNPLFNQFDTDVGWDHPNNARFQKLVIPVYGCAYHEGELPDTRFQYFTGAATLFPANAPISLADIKDGTSSTFLFAEADQPVVWTRPADMIVRPDQALPLPSDHFIAAMADSTVHFIDRTKVSDAILRQLINPNDQKPDGGWDDN